MLLALARCGHVDKCTNIYMLIRLFLAETQVDVAERLLASEVTCVPNFVRFVSSHDITQYEHHAYGQPSG